MSATNARAARLHNLEDHEASLSALEVTAKIGALEPFVSAQEAAKFVGISRRFLIELARRGLKGAYPIGTGESRKTWVFRLSELASGIDGKRNGAQRRPPESESAYHPSIRRSLLK